MTFQSEAVYEEHLFDIYEAPVSGKVRSLIINEKN